VFNYCVNEFSLCVLSRQLVVLQFVCVFGKLTLLLWIFRYGYSLWIQFMDAVYGYRYGLTYYIYFYSCDVAEGSPSGLKGMVFCYGTICFGVQDSSADCV